MVEAEFGVKAAQLHALAAELAAAVSADTSGGLAVEVLPEVFGAGRQADLLTCRLIERADRSGTYADGAASRQAFVRQISGESDGWVSKRVQVGRALADRMPVTAKGWEAGELGLDHAAVIQQATRDLDVDLAADLEAFLAEQAAPLTPRQLRVVAEEVLAAAARKHAAQHLNLSETLDGRWRLDGWLDAEAGLVVSTAIAAFTRKPDPAGELLTESVGSRRAEALVQMARHATAHAQTCHGQGGGRHTVMVGLSHQALLDGSAPPAPRKGSGCPPQPPGEWRAMAASSRPSTEPTPKPWTSVAVPAPSATAYATTWSPATAAAPSPAADGHRPSPKPITVNIGLNITAKPGPTTSISSAHITTICYTKAAGA